MPLRSSPFVWLLRKEWREASSNLGASSFQFWRHVGMPVLFPSIVSAFILLFGNSFAAYATAYALTSGTGLPLVPPFRNLVRGILGMDFVEAVELSNDARYLMGVLPAANQIATADELCEFYQMLLNGGTLHGNRVFDARTVWRATSEQSYGELDFTLGVPLRYSLGFMLGAQRISLYGPDTEHAFGHLGFTNIIGWADPERALAGGLVTSGKPVLYPELVDLWMLMRTIGREAPKAARSPLSLL